MAGVGSTSWQGDFSNFVGLDRPFMGKGGLFWDNSNAGRFYFYRNDGNSHFRNGFRPVVVPVL